MNEEVMVRQRTKEAFELAFRLIFLDNYKFNGSEKVYESIGYKVIKNELFISKYSDDCTKFAYNFDIKQTIEFAWGWWQKNKSLAGREPDTDGSTDFGFEISTERCGVGSKDWGMFVSVKPIWFVYGK